MLLPPQHFLQDSSLVVVVQSKGKNRLQFYENLPFLPLYFVFLCQMFAQLLF